MKKRPEYIVVARLGKPRGVSGEINLKELTDNPKRFDKPGVFWLESDGGWTEIRIISVKRISGRPVIRIEGIDTIEKAQELTGQHLFIPFDQLGKLPEGKHYYFDIIGCRVINESGRELGRIIEIEDFPANEVWVIETGREIEGLDEDEKKKNRLRLFPVVKEFVKEIDIDNGVIIITPPEGIFDSPDED